MLSTDSLDILFSKARSHKAWLDQEISEIQIHKIYDLLKFAPTSGNCCPARFTFVRSDESKQKILPSLDKGNIDKVMSAPCVVIISYDLKFYESLSILSPHSDAKSSFEGKDKKIKNTAEFNSTLQGEFLEFMSDILLSQACRNRGVFDKKYINQVINSPRDYMTALNGSRLWHLALLEYWFQINVDK